VIQLNQRVIQLNQRVIQLNQRVIQLNQRAIQLNQRAIQLNQRAIQLNQRVIQLNHTLKLLSADDLETAGGDRTGSKQSTLTQQARRVGAAIDSNSTSTKRLDTATWDVGALGCLGSSCTATSGLQRQPALSFPVIF
jgi:hypothetical protein